MGFFRKFSLKAQYPACTQQRSRLIWLNVNGLDIVEFSLCFYRPENWTSAICLAKLRKNCRIIGTGHYLWPGGAEDFRGDHLISGRTKGGISRTWEPKRGDHWKLWKDSGGGEFAWKWTYGEWGGSRKSSKVIRGDDLSDVSFKGGIG